MKRQEFSLKPFHESGRERITIRSEIGRSKGILSLTCEVYGLLSDILIPKPAAVPERRDRLWEETCFEFFISPKGSKHYWEFNLSPSGHWNIYRFASYRESMKAEADFESLPFVVKQEPNSLKVSVELPLNLIIDEDQAIEVSVCAVTKKIDQENNYWALIHSGQIPDFHLGDSFLIQL